MNFFAKLNILRKKFVILYFEFMDLTLQKKVFFNIVNGFISNYNRVVDLKKNLRYYRLRAKGAKI